MLDATSSYIGQPLSALPVTVLQWCRGNGIRPTVKAVPAQDVRRSKHHLVASFTDGKRKGHSARAFNLPGGGVEPGHNWIGTLTRELTEEVPELNCPQALCATAPILAMESIGTTRPGFRGKLMVVVGLLLPERYFREDLLHPDGHELNNLKIKDICQTILRLRALSDTNKECALVYKSALENLRPLLTR